MRRLNLIGTQVRKLRYQRNWSQNDLAIKLQILGMEDATRGKVSKIEARLVWVSDDDILYLARALRVGLADLYPETLPGASDLYGAICQSKASRFGAIFLGSLSCSQTGAGVLEIAFSIATL